MFHIHFNFKLSFRCSAQRSTNLDFLKDKTDRNTWRSRVEDPHDSIKLEETIYKPLAAQRKINKHPVVNSDNDSNVDGRFLMLIIILDDEIEQQRQNPRFKPTKPSLLSSSVPRICGSQYSSYQDVVPKTHKMNVYLKNTSIN